MTALLALGIDPNPMGATSFAHALDAHCQLIDIVDATILKPNLAFFLAHGSDGIKLLEEFCARYRQSHQLILDGKFGEISTSLEAYLTFGFRMAQSVTLNPFLGSQSLVDACKMRDKHSGKNIYVLCATSQNSEGPLAYIQQGYQHTIEACRAAQLGVVIGANRLLEMRLAGPMPILAPGLGAQSASLETLDFAKTTANEIIFPISRGIFAGGNQSLQTSLEAYEIWKRKF